MKRIVLSMVALSIVTLCALTKTEMTTLAQQPVETTHALMILKVPVLTDGLVMPDVPKALRELRTTDITIYDDEEKPANSKWCLVFMLVPEGNVAAFLDSADAFSVTQAEVITVAKEDAAEVSFPALQSKKSAVLERIANADSYKSATP